MSITRYLRIDENNTLSLFMLSGSIELSIPFSFSIKSCIYQNNAFIQYQCNVKDTNTNTLFNTIISLFDL